MKEQQTSTLLDSQASSFNKFLRQTKFLIFDYTSNLLKEDNFNIFVRLIFYFIETLQLINFCFRDQIVHIWKSDSFTDKFFMLLDFTYFTPYLKQQSYETYQAVSLTLGSVIFICVIDIAFVLYQVKISGSATGFPLLFIRTASELFGSILYVPSLDLFLSVFQCEAVDGI